MYMEPGIRRRRMARLVVRLAEDGLIRAVRPRALNFDTSFSGRAQRGHKNIIRNYWYHSIHGLLARARSRCLNPENNSELWLISNKTGNKSFPC